MTEDGTGPGGEDRRHPRSFPGYDPVANDLNAPVHEVEAPAIDTMVDRARRDPEVEQLEARDDTVLTLCQVGDHPVNLTAVNWTLYDPVS
ncbi:MAG TPA: hypothetical protein VHE14_00680 [Solirubrobacteraceae bacterium]|nr:hypothetical protein [Solirubrobacteraceae bacterium]